MALYSLSHFCIYIFAASDIAVVYMKVLNVAEKPTVAKEISIQLSNGGQSSVLPRAPQFHNN